MGANLSSTAPPVDKSGIVLAENDARADMILAGMWIGVLYTCAMIFSTCFLIDRWSGSKGNSGAGSVMVAFLVSAAWPAVLVYMTMSG
jgi:hypothetical protein